MAQIPVENIAEEIEEEEEESDEENDEFDEVPQFLTIAAMQRTFIPIQRT